ncbi:MAG TPA: aminotransferase class I/II-fold pyridoxal phosphate-dependent enzyme [Kineosporiaceae bacterium]|nr:aminotransferase class I/II-fold pyridoxal phosphate-dependent enzyme [Kineosporiaceae bacterium]
MKPDFDLTDDELRAAGSVKWNLESRDVLPAWVAEMDVRPCPAVAEAVADAVRLGEFGYPAPDAHYRLPEATAAFLTRRFGRPVDPALVLGCGDVMAGVRLALETLCEDAPVVVPTPAYPPFLDIVRVTRRRLVTVPAVAGSGRLTLDVEGIGRALAGGARTVLLAQPHNPIGRVYTAPELTALRDVADRYGARVIADEIHAPLLQPGVAHVPYAGLEGTAGHVTTVFAASKAWNTPGLKCAQIIAGTPQDRAALEAVPHVANHGISSLGPVATVAAYTEGEAWLDGVLDHLAAQRDLFGALLAELLPQLSWEPMEGTYLAWVDARPTGLADPALTALERGRVMVNRGATFGPGHEGFVRVNLATSAERLRRIVERLAEAWTA